MRLSDYMGLAEAAGADTEFYRRGHDDKLEAILLTEDPQEAAMLVTYHALEHFRLYRSIFDTQQAYQGLCESVMRAVPESRCEELFADLLRSAESRTGPAGRVKGDVTYEELKEACTAMVARALAGRLTGEGRALPITGHMRAYLSIERAIDKLPGCVASRDEGELIQKTIRYYYVEGNRIVSASVTSALLGLGQTSFYRYKKRGVQRMSGLLFPDMDMFRRELAEARKTVCP